MFALFLYLYLVLEMQHNTFDYNEFDCNINKIFVVSIVMIIFVDLFK